MFKKSKNLIILVLYFVSNEVFALNSSSYLISNTAIKLYDYEIAYSEYSNSQIDYNEKDLQDQLLVLINLNLLNEANDVAKYLLDVNEINQEAWLVYLANAKLNNKLEPFDQYKNNVKPSFKLIDYIFYNKDNQIKETENISQSILELIQASVTSDKNKNSYDYVLFYLAIANLIDPNFYEGYFYSAQIYQSLKKYESAEKLYNKITRDHILYVDSQKNIAINNSKIGLFENAEKKLLQLVNLYPNELDLVFAIADLYRIEKKYEKGIEYYSKLINIYDASNEKYWRLLYLRGICFERLLKWNLAEKDFLKSLKINNESPQVLNYLAYGWLERNENLNTAMEMLQKAYKENSNSYFILDSLAWAYFKLKDFDKAAELMEEVIVMAPGEAISLDHLGDIYFAMNRKREAYFFWKQALDLATPLDAISDSLKKKINKNYEG